MRASHVDTVDERCEDVIIQCVSMIFSLYHGMEERGDGSVCLWNRESYEGGVRY